MFWFGLSCRPVLSIPSSSIQLVGDVLLIPSVSASASASASAGQTLPTSFVPSRRHSRSFLSGTGFSVPAALQHVRCSSACPLLVGLCQVLPSSRSRASSEGRRLSKVPCVLGAAALPPVQLCPLDFRLQVNLSHLRQIDHLHF